MKRKILFFILFSFSYFLTMSNSWAANIIFSNATVGVVEARSDTWGAWIIMTIIDSSGNRIVRLCDTAGDPGAIALPLSDSAAKSILAIALTAKISGKPVQGWGIDPPQGNWCGIGNLNIM
jgi:hypothetical protein